ncbi:unnamed protein product, partial [Rotaria magnacalcarata]
MSSKVQPEAQTGKLSDPSHETK